MGPTVNCVGPTYLFLKVKTSEATGFCCKVIRALSRVPTELAKWHIKTAISMVEQVGHEGEKVSYRLNQMDGGDVTI